jgi:hypothetical protein
MADVLLEPRPVRLALFCLLGVTGCFDVPEHPGPLVASHVDYFEIPISGRPKLDLLFVIDRSTAMVPYRQDLVAKFGGFADVLAATGGGMPDVNIAVASAHAGDNGAFRTTSRVDGAFVIDGMRDGVRVQNYTGDLGSLLAELADLGASESAPPRPLDVVSLAVAQPEFLRDNAFLAIVTIAATDDASAVAVGDAAGALKSLKSDAARVLVVGIYPESSSRLDAFLDQFPNRTAFTPIGAADPTEGFRDLFRPTSSPGGVACLELTPSDIDPNTPGVQVDCVVELLDHATGTISLVPRCTGDVTPCWDFEPESQYCGAGGGTDLAFQLELGDEGMPYEGALIRGQCLVEGN